MKGRLRLVVMSVVSAAVIVSSQTTAGQQLAVDAAVGPSSQLCIDTPTTGSAAETPVNIAGWALDRMATAGSGIDAVHVYAYPSGGGPPIFIGVATYGLSRPDVGAAFGGQFTKSGYSLLVPELAEGAYTLVALGHSTVTGVFDVATTVSVTIAKRKSRPAMSLDRPSSSSSLGRVFFVSGWAIDLAATTGTGVDLVHIWAFPTAGGPGIPIGAATYGLSRPDVGAAFGNNRFTPSGFQLAANLSPGSYTINAYMRSMVSGTFNLLTSATNVTVQSTYPVANIESPAASATLSRPFTLSGWAADTGSAAGTGIDAIHVWAFPVPSGAPIFVGAATYGGSRTDVGGYLGDSRFNNSGYSLTVTSSNLPAPGTYDLNVYARSTVTGTFTPRVVRVIVADPPDVTPPIVAITTPSAGATVSGTTSVTATASDNVGVASVRFKLDGAALGAADSTSPYSVSWNTPTTSNGTHTLTAIARDAAGNETTSAAVVLTVNNTPSDPLIAAYAFDESGGTTASDRSVINNTGVVSGAAWTASCKFGNCLSFNGTSSFVEAPDIDAVTPGTDATFEAWVFLNSAPAETASVFNKWNQTNDDEYLVGISPSRTLYFAWHTTGGNTWPSASFNQAVSAGTIPLNTLTHIAVVRSGPLLTFYINGVANTALTVMDTNPFRNGVNTLRVGGQGRGSANRFFNGVIDEARMYNRALTPGEIVTDMSMAIVPDVTPPVLSAISASGLTSATATITWTTNEASDSQVSFGPTSAYGSTSPLVGAPLTQHVVVLAGLTPNTLYHYQVRSRDSAGNLAQSGDLTFTTIPIDVTPPVIALTAPAANATVSRLVTVSANATDNVGVVGVQFKLDGVNLGLEDALAPFAILWDSTTTSSGPHTLTAVAFDAAGNQTTSAPIAVTVSNNSQLTLAWDANTEPNIAGYRLYLGDSSGVYFTNIDVGNAITATVTTLQAGHLYFFAVTAYDQAGAESGLSNEVSATAP